jgi:tRNA pseudouridine38-40 synthase
VPTFRFTLEYDGTYFEGWQAQGEGRRTVQGELEAALGRVTGRRYRIAGAGRTDAGVHAEGQVASTVLDTRLTPAELQRALNAVLPPDVAVASLEIVSDAFHARRDARAKLYRYAVWNNAVRSPRRERTHHAVAAPLDLEAMRAAAKSLLGTHDFAAFQAAGSSVRTRVRTLTRLDLEGEAGWEVFFWVQGSGFLRHMVRNLVGTLLEVGLGRRPPEDVARVLARKERLAAGPTAPARGLSLVRIDY